MELARRLLSNLFPSRCILCQQTVLEPALNQNIEVCSGCYQALPHNDHSCTHCALPLPEDIENDVLCGRCIKKRPIFDYSYSLFRYEEEIIKLVHQLKFGEKISYARSIGELLLTTVIDELLPEQGRPECIIPVPLHNGRLRKRGYNQSTEISRVVAKRTGIPIDYDSVVRQRSTLTQTGLKAKERQKNIKGAFKVASKPEAEHVLIVDDVITTGSTVNELAKVLKRQGVKRVGVLSIARAPLKT
ncbi:MAG: phosphoribosyltransferase family protein [Gammaproteobacteria bacterium]